MSIIISVNHDNFLIVLSFTFFNTFKPKRTRKSAILTSCPFFSTYFPKTSFTFSINSSSVLAKIGLLFTNTNTRSRPGPQYDWHP